MSRTQAPVGAINEKTYAAQSVITRGYFIAPGTLPGTITAVTAAGQRTFGLATGDSITEASGDAVPVTRSGDGIAIAGAAIPYGSDLTTDALGRVIPVTGAGGEYACARAEDLAVALGDEITVFVYPPRLG